MSSNISYYPKIRRLFLLSICIVKSLFIRMWLACLYLETKQNALHPLSRFKRQLKSCDGFLWCFQEHKCSITQVLGLNFGIWAALVFLLIRQLWWVLLIKDFNFQETLVFLSLPFLGLSSHVTTLTYVNYNEWQPLHLPKSFLCLKTIRRKTHRIVVGLILWWLYC